MICKLDTFSPGMLADIDKQICTFFRETNIITEITIQAQHNKMHLLTFNPNCYLVCGFQFGQRGKISAGEFAYIDKHSGTLCLKSDHNLKTKTKTQQL